MPLAAVSLLAAAAIVLLPALWLLRAHNALVHDRHQLENARRQIDVQLARRHDLIPNLVAAVRGALAHERDTLEALVAARGSAIAAARAGVSESAMAEERLTAALGRTVAVVESHPELRALHEVATLQEELRSTENRIAFARQHYNDSVARYNTRQELLPGSLVARTAGVGRAEPWQAPAGVEQVPRVELTRATAG